MSSNKPQDNKASFDFSANLKELEDITSYLESSEVDLTKAIDKFERGTKLAKQLKDYLQTAKNKVETLKQSFEK